MEKGRRLARRAALLVITASIIAPLGWMQAATDVSQPITVLMSNLAQSTGHDEQEGEVRWILPGPRRLDPLIFGTPENPLGFERDVGVPLAARLTNEEGTAFTTTANPTPFSDAFALIGGSYDLTAIDVTLGDHPNSQDGVAFNATFTSPDGQHTYDVQVNQVLPVGLLHSVLMASTFAHQTGYLFGVHMPVMLGGTGVFMDVWQALRAAELIEAEGVTWTMGATPFLSDLAYAPNLEQHDLTTLQLFLSAGAAIPRQLVTDARERLGCSISAGWGMTENALVTVNQVDDPPEKVFGTDGCCVNGMEVQVIDDDGQPLTAGEEGDLVSRGPQHFAGYYQRPQITAESFTEDGWFKTGDRAILDDDGYISICGRSKDIIIRGGENIPVVEVENLLHKHPKVLNVAIVGMPDARLQEKACAFVIPQPGETLTFGDMVDYLLEQQLAKQYLPERLEIVTEFPMTPSGKVQKYQLRQHIAALLEQEGN